MSQKIGTDWDNAAQQWLNEFVARGILTTDTELTIRSWNHWLETHSGRRAEEVVGRNLLAVYPELVERGLERYYREALAGRVHLLSQRLHRYLLPMPPVHPGPDQMAQSAQIAPLVQDDDIIGTITVIEDVTERVERENALRQSEARYRTISELTSDFAYAFQVEPDGTLVLEWITEAFIRVTGFSSEEVLASNDWKTIVLPDDAAVALQHEQTLLANQPDVSEFRIVTKRGKVRWLRDYARPVWDEAQGRVVRVFGAAQDITEKVRAEKQIKASLEEKEVLLREIHHRVKNNLQALIYLIDMQAETMTDAEVIQALEDLQGRTRAMAIVHERLYQSADLNQVDFSNYLYDLTSQLFYAFKDDRNIALRVEAADIFININIAIPCGLMVNELVTNALRHAFPPSHTPEEIEGEQASDEIRVVFELQDNEYILTVSDNGIGLPPELDWRKAQTLGLKLVNIWATRQLAGSIEVDTRHGTTFEIRFQK